MKTTPLVIGISGISGGGKSTLANALSKRLRATLISWDDYDDISISPPDYADWHESGRPNGFAAWRYPQLAQDLHDLKQANSFVSKIDGTVVVPSTWIVFDAPLGRDHQETGQYIDVHIDINTPLDVALGRRMLRDFSETHSATDILEEMRFYLERSRPLFLDTFETKPDLVLDGLLPNEEKVEAVVYYLELQKKETEM